MVLNNLANLTTNFSLLSSKENRKITFTKYDNLHEKKIDDMLEIVLKNLIRKLQQRYAIENRSRHGKK